MFACKTAGEYKKNQEKIKRFCLEEEAKQAKEEEERAKQARAKPLQPATTARQNVVNRKQMGHAEVVVLARRNQQSQRGARTTRQAKQQPKPSSIKTPKSPGLLRDHNGWRTPATELQRKPRSTTLIQNVERRQNNIPRKKPKQQLTRQGSCYIPVPRKIKALHP